MKILKKSVNAVYDSFFFHKNAWERNLAFILIGLKNMDISLQTRLNAPGTYPVMSGNDLPQVVVA
jgi:hypothetical protein